MSDLLEYDKAIVETLQHIEEVLVKYSLQNYATAGALFLVYYTQGRVPHWIAAVAIIGIGAVFLLAIWANVYRYTMIYRMHQIIRDHWLLAEQTELRKALYADKDLQKHLTNAVRFPKSSWPAIALNALPVAAGVVQLLIDLKAHF